jgi:hypothetical protein
MDYELAKSLMDAGFPQIGKGSLIGPLDKLVWRSGDRVYVPTLEELIEACGENFGSLDKQHYGWLAYAPYDQSYFAKTSVPSLTCGSRFTNDCRYLARSNGNLHALTAL